MRVESPFLKMNTSFIFNSYRDLQAQIKERFYRSGRVDDSLHTRTNSPSGGSNKSYQGTLPFATLY